MAVKELGDPRLQALFGASDPRDGGVRPTVRLPSRGLPPVVFLIIMALAATLLFAVLNGRRTSPAEPSVRARAADSATTSWEVPPLYVPPVQAPRTDPVLPSSQGPAQPAAAAPAPIRAVVTGNPAPQIVYAPQPVPELGPAIAPTPPVRAAPGAPLVIDTSAAAAGSSGQNGGPSTASQAQPITRMRASVLANRSMTVPQGYLIPAVLETGFDSTKPGFARAVVSKDVRGFDGKNVLIPRGSRLIGTYVADIAPGQRRAIISWTRLIRPDGMTITLDSPAVDTLGRGGVPASVNTHFFQRLGDALLQSTVDIGRGLAGRAATGPIVVVPGNPTSAATPMTFGSNYAPTLTVPPGRSISVFVAHDLDFSAAGAGR